MLLAFCPLWHGPTRTLAVALFAGFHGGILILSQIDLFAVIGMLAWIVFLPGWFWTFVAGWRQALPADGSPFRHAVPRLQGAVALALVGYVGFLNAAGLCDFFGLGDPAPPAFRAPALVLQLDQEWRMFSPEPAPWTRYLAARGAPPGCRSTSSPTGSRAARAKRRFRPRDGTHANGGLSTCATFDAYPRNRETGWAGDWPSTSRANGTRSTTRRTGWSESTSIGWMRRSSGRATRDRTVASHASASF